MELTTAGKSAIDRLLKWITFFFNFSSYNALTVCKIAKQGKGIPKSTKNCFHPTTLKVQGLFQDVNCDSSVFQEKIRFKDAKQNFKTFSQNPTKIQDFLTPPPPTPLQIIIIIIIIIIKFDNFSIQRELCDGRTSTCLQPNVPFWAIIPLYYHVVHFTSSSVIYGCCCIALIYR